MSNTTASPRASACAAGPLAHHRPDDRGPDRCHLRRRLLGLVHGVHHPEHAVATCSSGPASVCSAAPWLIAGVVAGLVVRRPGAAFFAEVLAAVVEALSATSGAGPPRSPAACRVSASRSRWRSSCTGASAGRGAPSAGALAALFEFLYEWNAYWQGTTLGFKIVRSCSWRPARSSPGSAAGCWSARSPRPGAIDALPAGREAAARQRA